jgi:Xaa-Pro aminopeptidase
MQKRKIDFVCIINATTKDPTMQYLTGIAPEYAFLLTKKGKKSILFISAMEYEWAKKHSKIKNIKMLKSLDQIKKVVKNRGVGINERYVTVAVAKQLKKKFRIISADNICRNMRIIKTKNEIECIKKAAQETDRIFTTVCKNIQKFKTEKDIAVFIEKTAKYPLAFDTIVASGSNASMPHHTPGKTTIKGFCILDFGVKYKEYCSDMSRTIYVGTPTQKEKQAYAKVKTVQEYAIENATIGKKCASTAKEICKILKFPHSLGHGIGIAVHEAPAINEKSTDVFKENMCFTIEPGMYVQKKFGIRIEDDVVLTKKGPIVLTKSTKTLLCFKHNV